MIFDLRDIVVLMMTSKCVLIFFLNVSLGSRSIDVIPTSLYYNINKID